MKQKEAMHVSAEESVNLPTASLIAKYSWGTKCLGLPSQPTSLELSDHCLYFMVTFLICSLLALTRDLVGRERERESKPYWHIQGREGNTFILSSNLYFLFG